MRLPLLPSLLSALTASAQTLLTFRVPVQPRGQGAAYLSLQAGKAFTENAAPARQVDLDCAYLAVQCGTVADRRRMTGNDSANAFSFCGKVTNKRSGEYRCHALHLPPCAGADGMLHPEQWHGRRAGARGEGEAVRGRGSRGRG